MDPEAYEEQLNQLIDSYDGNVFVCVDIMGGTPFKSLAKAARTPTPIWGGGCEYAHADRGVIQTVMSCPKGNWRPRLASVCRDMVMDLT